MMIKKYLLALSVFLVAGSMGFTRPAQAQAQEPPTTQPETLRFGDSQVLYGGYLTRFDTKIVNGKIVIVNRVPRPVDAPPINLQPLPKPANPIVLPPDVDTPSIVLPKPKPKPQAKPKPKQSSVSPQGEPIYRGKGEVSWYSPGDSGLTTATGGNVWNLGDKYGSFVATRDIVPFGSVFYQVKCSTLNDPTPVVIKKLGPRMDWGPAEWTGRILDIWVPSHATAINNGHQDMCLVAYKGKKV
jgi:hypothetical protein